jgi:hypothetical protein
MQRVYELPISFTFDQVIAFGNLTGDNGPVHSIDGVVQGGFILSMLPKWLIIVMKQNHIDRTPGTVSAILESKFRNKLQSNHKVIVSFDFESMGKRLSKIKWRIFDIDKEYCSGNWIIHKS